MMTLIIALAASSVLVAAAYFAARAHTSRGRISGGEDFLTAYSRRVSRNIRESGIGIGNGAYYAILVAASAGLFAGTYVLASSWLAAALCGIFGLFVPRGIVALYKMSRDRNFEKYFLRSLEQLDSSLRAGASISQSVDDVAGCKFVHESLRRRYAKLSGDIHMGIGVGEAFRAMAADLGSIDAEDLALAIEIQEEVGGREADAVRQISNNIKDRIMTRKEVKSIFSGESSMIWIMDFLVPGMILFFCAASPDYVSAYFESAPMTLLFIGFFVMSIAGSLVNHRMLRKAQGS